MARLSVLFAALLAMTCSPVLGQSKTGTAEPVVLEVKDFGQLSQKFCAADPKVNHILILPAALFVDSQQVICGDGPYKLYRVIDATDGDDFEYFLDPPFGTEERLGCDGKAGKSMPVIAVNCRTL